MTDALAKRDPYELTVVGFRPLPGMRFEDWDAAGAWISTVGQACQWWQGDWLNYGEDAFGEAHAQALDPHRWSLETLRVYAWVCQRIPPERRVASLSFSHHQQVASLEPAEQTALLTQALGENGCPWSVAELGRAVRAAKHTPQTWRVSAKVDSEEAAERLRALIEASGYAHIEVVRR